MTDNNPFKIPNLRPMLEAVTEYVKEHQGERGFILTDVGENDTIHSIEYDFYLNSVQELHVKAVRVNEHGRMEILTELFNIKYNEQAVKAAKETDWMDVEYTDSLYFVPTIFNIAENIAEYVDSLENDFRKDKSVLQLWLLYPDGTKKKVTGIFTEQKLTEKEIADIPADYKRYYIRHSDGDDSVPVTISPRVVAVNRYGILFLKENLFGEDDYNKIKILDWKFIG